MPIARIIEKILLDPLLLDTQEGNNVKIVLVEYRPSCDFRAGPGKEGT